jgi:carboxylesterase type B
MNYWINFAYYLDPNGCEDNMDSSAVYWPAHEHPENRNMMRMDPGAFSVVQDDYREEQMAVWDLPGMPDAMNYRRGLGGIRGD